MTRGVRCPFRKVGTRFTNSIGETVTILEDVDYKQVKFRFDSGTEGIVEYQHLKNLEFYDWMAPSVCGVGYLGAPIQRKGGTSKLLYSRWSAMLQRCYDDSDRNKTYEGAIVCDEWHNFQNFAKWIKSQRNGETKGWHLDKDVIVRNRGKLYSPETCICIPVEINSTVTSLGRKQGNCKSLGVWYDKKSNSYVAACAWDKIKHELGRYKTEAAAYLKYKETKEWVVKNLAEKYKSELDPRAYEALLKWELMSEGDIS
jgi:hypothetical protein